MRRLSLNLKETEDALNNCIENDENVFNNDSIKKKSKKSIFNNRRSISISNEDYNENSILFRKSINIKYQLEQNKSLFTEKLSSQLPRDKLNQLCNQCLNLLRQNKISTKNAFDIILIDHLNDIVNAENTKSLKFEKESFIESNVLDETQIDVNNDFVEDGNFEKFQRAAVTLEASARIYGYRVDSTFDNAYKILSSIKNGQILLNDEEINDEYNNSNDEDILSQKNELLEKKIIKKKDIYTENDNTIVDNNLISIKNFDKSKDIIEKPYFVKFLDNETKINKIRFGVEYGNLGSISSMLMNNLELKEFSNNENSISISFNISGKNKIDHIDSVQKIKNDLMLLKVNSTTLNMLLSNDTNSDIISPELTKILDSIEEINAQYNDNKEINNSIIVQHFNDYDDSFSNKKYNSNSETQLNNIDIYCEDDKIDDIIDNNCEKDNEFNDNLIGFQHHINDLFQKYSFDADSRQLKTISQEQDFYSIDLGHIIDYLTINKFKNKNFSLKTNHVKSNSKSNNQKNTINFNSLIKNIDDNLFDGIEYFSKLPKNQIIENSPKKTKTKLQNDKVFIDECNTTSIFNYNLNHLFCLANLTGRKIDLLSIHNPIINNSNQLFINSQDECLDDYSTEYRDIDLITSEYQIEENDSQKNDLINNYIVNNKLLITPIEQTSNFDKETLLEKTSKSILIENQNYSILKSNTSSTHIDVDVIKKYLKYSIQTLNSTNQTLDLANIINLSVSSVY